MIRIFIMILALAGTARAEGERSGNFDYYVMSLSWSPNWCALEGDRKKSEQCETRHDYGWILHGLWPQYTRGWPSYCKANTPAPSRRMTSQMTDIMGTSGLAWHQWKKHGSCTGLTARDYYRLSREAYSRIKRPEILRKVTSRMQLPAKVIEQAFLEVNPGLEPDMITVTCKLGHIQEARICFTRDLKFTTCGAEALRDCTLSKATFNPIR